MRPDYPPPTPAEISVFVEDGHYVFRTADGASIYTCARDRNGHSTCIARCAESWPAVIALPAPRPIADWTTYERPDKSLQWVYRTQPLYTYAYDQPGKALGNGIDGVWRVVAP